MLLFCFLFPFFSPLPPPPPPRPQKKKENDVFRTDFDAFLSVAGQQQSFRPFGLGQRPYLPDNLRELDSQRRKTEALTSIHPTLGFGTGSTNLGTCFLSNLSPSYLYPLFLLLLLLLTSLTFARWASIVHWLLNHLTLSSTIHKRCPFLWLSQETTII